MSDLILVLELMCRVSPLRFALKSRGKGLLDDARPQTMSIARPGGWLDIFMFDSRACARQWVGMGRPHHPRWVGCGGAMASVGMLDSKLDVWPERGADMRRVSKQRRTSSDSDIAVIH